MPNQKLKKFKSIAGKAKAQNQKLKKEWSLISLSDSDSETEGKEELVNTKAKPASSENLAKLPTLSEEEFAFFKLVQDGDLLGLKDFMGTPAYGKIHINKTDKFGFCALHHAVRRQDEDMVSLFLKQDGILTYDTLFHAIEEENISITRMLLEHQDKHTPKVVPPTFGKIVPPVTGTSLTIVGLPTVLSPTKITSRKSLQDLEEFDSEFPTYATPLLLSASRGNYTLMEIFYERGERLESLEEHHNCGCPCSICSKTDRKLSNANERLHLFDALTNPKYICFISKKNKSQDPADYAIQKIKKCNQLEMQENMFEGQFLGYKTRLSNFLKDLVDLCRTNEESLTFFSVPDASIYGRLKNKYPRMWTLVELRLVDVVAHPHSQYVAYQQWANLHWPEWSSYNVLRMTAELVLRIIFLPVFVLLMWFGCEKTWAKKLSSPVGKCLNYAASYCIFLAIVTAQVLLPQRCNNDGVPFTVLDADCKERGAPNIGTEWVLVLYVFGTFVSLMKRNAVPWLWNSSWTWYELWTQILFLATFVCWGWAWTQRIPKNQHSTTRASWGQYFPEILAEMFLSVACILAFGSTMRLFQLNQTFGPLQLALGRMVKNFKMGGLVYFIVLYAFSTGLNAIYIPFNGLEGRKGNNTVIQSSPFGDVLKAPEELFWSLYGMSGSDKPSIVSFSILKSPALYEVRHHVWSERAGRLLFLSFHILGVLMMFNMLVAYFAAGADEVTKNADAEWKFARTQIYLTYMKETELPTPYNLIPTYRGIKHFCKYIKYTCCVDERSGKKASCSFHQCCFIKRPINKEDERDHKRKYRALVLLLIHRYNGKDIERANQSPATSDDVKEIGEELAELKSEIQSKMREMQEQLAKNSKLLKASQSAGLASTTPTQSVGSGVGQNVSGASHIRRIGSIEELDMMQLIPSVSSTPVKRPGLTSIHEHEEIRVLSPITSQQRSNNVILTPPQMSKSSNMQKPLLPIKSPSPKNSETNRISSLPTTPQPTNSEISQIPLLLTMPHPILPATPKDSETNRISSLPTISHLSHPKSSETNRISSLPSMPHLLPSPNNSDTLRISTPPIVPTASDALPQGQAHQTSTQTPNIKNTPDRKIPSTPHHRLERIETPTSKIVSTQSPSATISTIPPPPPLPIQSGESFSNLSKSANISKRNSQEKENKRGD